MADGCRGAGSGPSRPLGRHSAEAVWPRPVRASLLREGIRRRPLAVASRVVASALRVADVSHGPASRARLPVFCFLMQSPQLALCIRPLLNGLSVVQSTHVVDFRVVLVMWSVIFGLLAGSAKAFAITCFRAPT